MDNNYFDRRKIDDQQINLKRIKQILFGNHFKINQKNYCTKKHITYKHNYVVKEVHIFRTSKILIKYLQKYII